MVWFCLTIRTSPPSLQNGHEQMTGSSYFSERNQRVTGTQEPVSDARGRLSESPTTSDGLINIDVDVHHEAAELAVLGGIDFARHSISYIRITGTVEQA